jgi:hypothetical protein
MWMVLYKSFLVLNNRVAADKSCESFGTPSICSVPFLVGVYILWQKYLCGKWCDGKVNWVGPG